MSWYFANIMAVKLWEGRGMSNAVIRWRRTSPVLGGQFGIVMYRSQEPGGMPLPD